MTFANVRYATNGGVTDILSADWSAYDFIEVESYNPAAQICPARYIKLAAAPSPMPPLTFPDAKAGTPNYWQIDETHLNPAMAGATGNPQGDDSWAFNDLWTFLSSFIGSGKFINQVAEIDLGSQSWRTKKPVYWTDNGQGGRVEVGNGTIMASNNDGLCPIALDLAGSQRIIVKDSLYITGLTAEPGITSMALNTTAAESVAGSISVTVTTIVGSVMSFGVSSAPTVGMIAYNSTTKTLIPGWVTSSTTTTAIFSGSLAGVAAGNAVVFLPNVLQFSSASFPSWLVAGMAAHDAWSPAALTGLTVIAVQTSGGTTFVSFSGPVQVDVASGDSIMFQVQSPNIGVRVCRSQARGQIYAVAGGHDLRLLQFSGSFKECGFMNFGSETNEYPIRPVQNSWGAMQVWDGASLVTTAATAANGTVLNFASVPPWVQPGMAVCSKLWPGGFSAWVTVRSVTSTTVTLTDSVGANGVLIGDTIFFSQSTKYLSPWVATSASTAVNGTVMTFAGVPTWVRAGMPARSSANSSALSGLTVAGVTATTVTMSGPITAGIASGDVITFPAPPMMSGDYVITGSSDYVFKWSPSLSALMDYVNPAAVVNGTGPDTSHYYQYDSYNAQGVGIGSRYSSPLRMWPWDRMPLVTTSVSNGGSNTLTFASVPSWVIPGIGMTALDVSSLVSPNPLAGRNVVSVTSTTVTFSGLPIPTGVLSGDTIGFNAGSAKNYYLGLNYLRSCTYHTFADYEVNLPSPIGAPAIAAMDTVGNTLTLVASATGIPAAAQPLRDGTQVYITAWSGIPSTTASADSNDAGGVTTLYVALTTGITVGMSVSDGSVTGNPLDGLTVASIGAGSVTLSGLSAAVIASGDILVFGASNANSNNFFVKTVMSPLPNSSTYKIQLYTDRYLTDLVTLAKFAGLSPGVRPASLFGSTGSGMVIAGASSFSRAFGYALTYGSPFVLFDASYNAAGAACNSWSFELQHEAIPQTSIEYLQPATGSVSHSAHRFIIENLAQNWEWAPIAAESVGSAGILSLTDLELGMTTLSSPPWYGYFKNAGMINPINWRLKLSTKSYMNSQISFHLRGAMELRYTDANQTEDVESYRNWTPNLQFGSVTADIATQTNSATITLSSTTAVPSWVVVGMSLADAQAPGALVGLTVSAVTGSTTKPGIITMSGNVGATISAGDIIVPTDPQTFVLSAATLTSSAVLTCASGVPSWVTVGQPLYENPHVNALAGLTVLSKTATTITMSGNVLATIIANSVITPSAPVSALPFSGTAGWWERSKNGIRAHFSCKLASVGTLTGAAQIVNLPKPANNSTYLGSMSIGNYSGLTISGSIPLSPGGQVLVNQPVARLLNLSCSTGGAGLAASTLLNASYFTNTSLIEGDIFYMAPSA